MKAFTITLMREPVRKLNATHNKRFLETFGYHVDLVEAIDARGPKFRTVRVAEEAWLTAGEIACAGSHLKIYQEIVELGETCLILEDDAWIPKEIPIEWAKDIKHIMTCGAYDSSMEGAPKLEYGEDTAFGRETIGMPWGTQAYFLTPEGAEILIKAATPVLHAADVLLDTVSRDGRLQGCVAKDCFVGQDDIIHSDLGLR